jgi:phosphatidylglycerophosphate synthase
MVEMNQMKANIERRPIAARSWRFSQVITQWLIRCHASPNAISVAGMVFALLAGIIFAFTDQSKWFFLAGALFVLLRLFANMFDGMVAVDGMKVSPVGELYNEVPDRVSDAATLIGFGYALGSHPALGYVAACAALFVAYVRAMGKAAGAKNDFCGPMAKQQRMAVVIAISLFAAFLPTSWDLSWQGYGLPAVGLLVIIFGSVVTAFRRLNRIAHQLRNRPQ